MVELDFLSIGWHKHDINSHHDEIHTWRRSPDVKRFVIKGLYQQDQIDGREDEVLLPKWKPDAKSQD